MFSSRLFAWLLLFATGTALAAELPFQRTESRPPCTEYQPLKRAYFGDTHIHTRLSMDASLYGAAMSPQQAYDFARGEPLRLPLVVDGESLEHSVQLPRPLDFAIVTDHAELFGETHICNTPSLAQYQSWQCKVYRAYPPAGLLLFNTLMSQLPSADDSSLPRRSLCGSDGAFCVEQSLSIWEEVQAAANAAYDRSEGCSFSTFIGYEWSASPDVKNLHRNVIFRNEHVTERAIDYLTVPHVETLWARLQSECLDGGEGCDVLTVPHNSNLSAGLMFAAEDSWGQPITASYAQQRAKFEPLVEIFQRKGDAECAIGSADEFCSFEKMPYDTLARDKFFGLLASEPATNNYVRPALKQGLLYQQALGANPFQYGFIGSTDSHMGMGGMVSERDYPGHGAEGNTTRSNPPAGFTDKVFQNPGGLAVVWAEENSRDALFSAMRKRETYATSGPRIQLRFFGGWDYPQDLCSTQDWVAQGYREGVPMGGSLPPVEGRAAPRFAIQAGADPGTADQPGMPLQRIQVIKAWVDDGQAYEKVFDVAGNPANGASVDTQSCTTSGAGWQQLCAVWEDPDFDPAARSFYYARVLENPSCRWTRHQCVAAKVNCDMPGSVPSGLEACCSGTGYADSIQERAWSSPIWYHPAGEAATNPL